MKVIITLVLLQCFFIALISFGDIGFDHPGKYGFDFGHFILFSVIFCICWLSGIIYSIRKKKWKWIAIQIALPVAAIAYEIRPPKLYDSTEYQHLVGMSRTQVKEELGTLRGAVTGFFKSQETGKEEFIYLRDMEIIFSPDGKVKSVEAHDGY